MSSNITLIHGDCMDGMASMPDKAFDLAIVDPPYGVNIGTSVGGAKRLVRVGGEGKSSPKVIGGSMTAESPKKDTLRNL